MVAHVNKVGARFFKRQTLDPKLDLKLAQTLDLKLYLKLAQIHASEI